MQPDQLSPWHKEGLELALIGGRSSGKSQQVLKALLDGIYGQRKKADRYLIPCAPFPSLQELEQELAKEIEQ